MTRFLLSLDQAVDTVFSALQHALPGETYVPDVPSTTVLNIARALIADRQVDIAITGVRPGEKKHEIMVSEEEVNRCLRRGGYFVIQPMLPELCPDEPAAVNALDKELSSADNVLDLEGTIALLKDHHLTVDDTGESGAVELLR
jgi:UDP-glucose 4-epimerase